MLRLLITWIFSFNRNCSQKKHLFSFWSCYQIYVVSVFVKATTAIWRSQSQQETSQYFTQHISIKLYLQRIQAAINKPTCNCVVEDRGWHFIHPGGIGVDEFVLHLVGKDVAPGKLLRQSVPPDFDRRGTDCLQQRDGGHCRRTRLVRCATDTVARLTCHVACVTAHVESVVGERFKTLNLEKCFHRHVLQLISTICIEDKSTN